MEDLPILSTRDLGNGLAIWAATTVIALGGAIFGWALVKPVGYIHETPLGSLANWDGGWYLSVLERGYEYRLDDCSNVAFFPGYPVAARLFVAWGCAERLALVLVAQIALAISFITLHAYLRKRYSAEAGSIAPLTVLLLATFPTTFFFRMAYSEALFICLLTLFLLAAQCRAPLWCLAFIAGAASGTRAVGAGLTLLVCREIYWRCRSKSSFLLFSAILIPLSLSGLLAYMAFLQERFGDPFVFAKAQDAWNSHPNATASEKWLALVTLRPLWGSFDTGSGHFYACPILESAWHIQVSALNASVYLMGVLAITVGAFKRWLNVTETLMASVLLGIPYVTRGFESQFLSFARFTAVVLPMYIPLAFGLRRLPALMICLYFMLSSALVALLSALFAAGYHLV